MKELEVGLLADFYGALLNQKTRDILDRFYNQDMSLGEISQELGITRQGVRDYLTRAKKALTEYEDKLKMASKFYDLREKIIEYKDKTFQANSVDKDEVLKFLDSLLKLI
ncbi:MAG TPA: sigma factor-like helix-turn-helix DNA-binding protein [Clostridia bacterium]